MRKRINVDEVVETNENILVELLELDDLINNLRNDVSLIKNSYKGEDVDSIVDKYNARIESLNPITDTYKRMTNFYTAITNSFNDICKKYSEKVKEIKDIKNKTLSDPIDFGGENNG